MLSLLPAELCFAVFDFLHDADLVRLTRVSKTWMAYTNTFCTSKSRLPFCNDKLDRWKSFCHEAHLRQPLNEKRILEKASWADIRDPQACSVIVRRPPNDPATTIVIELLADRHTLRVRWVEGTDPECETVRWKNISLLEIFAADQGLSRPCPYPNREGKQHECLVFHIDRDRTYLASHTTVVWIPGIYGYMYWGEPEKRCSCVKGELHYSGLSEDLIFAMDVETLELRKLTPYRMPTHPYYFPRSRERFDHWMPLDQGQYLMTLYPYYGRRHGLDEQLEEYDCGFEFIIFNTTLKRDEQWQSGGLIIFDKKEWAYDRKDNRPGPRVVFVKQDHILPPTDATDDSKTVECVRFYFCLFGASGYYRSYRFLARQASDTPWDFGNESFHPPVVWTTDILLTTTRATGLAEFRFLPIDYVVYPEFNYVPSDHSFIYRRIIIPSRRLLVFFESVMPEPRHNGLDNASSASPELGIEHCISDINECTSEDFYYSRTMVQYEISEKPVSRRDCTWLTGIEDWMPDSQNQEIESWQWEPRELTKLQKVVQWEEDRHPEDGHSDNLKPSYLTPTDFGGHHGEDWVVLKNCIVFF
ncbi:hypothetical protein BJ508DRAFT_332657 [Ascobolus immersus RN42]|uniref:F-box domain-containing protein n=1 Tax=Ascobolus immersus RN42 TaxID=1160509 RepID=A0A3N4HNM9_ASCIM|nr:hypothetical protein BJ508DRAFT_332657 [Ascobolus immersus RN42]